MQVRRKMQMPEVRRWSRADKAYITVSQPTTVLVTIEIDDVALCRQLGGSAWHNKSKKAQLGHGMLKATAVEVLP